MRHRQGYEHIITTETTHWSTRKKTLVAYAPNSSDSQSKRLCETQIQEIYGWKRTTKLTQWRWTSRRSLIRWTTPYSCTFDTTIVSKTDPAHKSPPSLMPESKQSVVEGSGTVYVPPMQGVVLRTCLLLWSIYEGRGWRDVVFDQRVCQRKCALGRSYACVARCCTWTNFPVLLIIINLLLIAVGSSVGFLKFF